MAAIKAETYSRIVKIDIDTAEYIIGKIQDAVLATINNNTKCIVNSNRDIISLRAKSTTEMFEEFSGRLQDILNEIKKR